MLTCRSLLASAVNDKYCMRYCCKLLGKILDTDHARKVPCSRSSGYQDATAVFVDAQGAMLVLRTVQHLASQGVFKGSCGERVQRIEKALQDECKNRLGDMSLEGFDAERRLADIERSHNAAGVVGRCQRKLQEDGEANASSNGALDMTGDEESDSDGNENILEEPCFDEDGTTPSREPRHRVGAEGECLRNGKGSRALLKKSNIAGKSQDVLEALSHAHIFRLTVQGLEGAEKFSYIVENGKMQVLFK
jgi:hypothetical protein